MQKSNNTAAVWVAWLSGVQLYHSLSLLLTISMWHWLIIMQGGQRLGSDQTIFIQRPPIPTYPGSTVANSPPSVERAFYPVALDLWVCFVCCEIRRFVPSVTHSGEWNINTSLAFHDSHLRWWGVIWRRRHVAVQQQGIRFRSSMAI